MVSGAHCTEGNCHVLWGARSSCGVSEVTGRRAESLAGPERKARTYKESGGLSRIFCVKFLC